MLLVFDIGNTHIKMGVFAENDLIVSCRMTTSTKKTTDEYGVDIMTMLREKNVNSSCIHRSVVSSVVPNIMYSFCNAIKNLGRLSVLIKRIASFLPGFVRRSFAVDSANGSGSMAFRILSSGIIIWILWLLAA